MRGRDCGWPGPRAWPCFKGLTGIWGGRRTRRPWFTDCSLGAAQRRKRQKGFLEEVSLSWVGGWELEGSEVRAGRGRPLHRLFSTCRAWGWYWGHRLEWETDANRNSDSFHEGEIPAWKRDHWAWVLEQGSLGWALRSAGAV